MNHIKHLSSKTRKVNNKPRPASAGPERVSDEHNWRVSEAALEMYRERLKHKSDCDCFGCKLVLDYVDARQRVGELEEQLQLSNELISEHIDCFVASGKKYSELLNLHNTVIDSHNALRGGVGQACRHPAISAVVYDILIDALTETSGENEVNDD